MVHFESDYCNGAHPRVLQHLCDTNSEALTAYGADLYSARAKQKIAAACGCDCDVVLLTGGTQTNAIVIATMLRDYEGVISAVSGHINGHEAGAVEYSGHKILPLPAHAGKLHACDLRDFLAGFYADENREHMVFPGMVYISCPTEYGTLYTKAELTALSDLCRSYGIPLFLDGARLGYGLASPACDLTLPDIARLCDEFYIGGTKVGALCGEAVVFPHRNMPPHFLNSVKKRGAMLAKGRLTGVQFDALFTDDLYLRIAAHAIGMAEKLKTVLTDCGLPLYLDSPTNQQFVIVENRRLEALKGRVGYSFWETLDDTHTVIRLATSWSTTDDDLAALHAALQD